MTLASEKKTNLILRFPESKWNAISATPAFIYIVAVLAFIKNRFAILDFPLDDAWIHQVYAQALAFGHGFAYNVGQQEAGSTSPLWAIITAPAHWFEVLGTDFVVFAIKLAGVMLGLACVLTTQRIASHLIGSRLGGCIAAALFAVDPKFLFSTLSGMETCLLVAVLAGACLMLIEKKPLFFLLLIGLAPVIRPEALVLLPCSLLGLHLIWLTKRRIVLKTVACFLPILPMAMWIGFCFYATNHALPNTFYLKANRFSLGIPELTVGLRAITQYGLVSPWLFLAGICVFGLLCLKRKSCAMPPLLFLVVVPLVYVLGVVGSRKVILEGYYWTRWIDPSSLLFTMAFCIGCGFVLASAADAVKDLSVKRALSRKSTTEILISLVGVAVLFMSGSTFVASFTNRRSYLASDSRAIAIMNVQMGKWIKENTPESATVGVNDAGAIRYFGQRHTIDLIGLNNADIAFGKITKQEAIAKADWLAIFPHWFTRGGMLDLINDDFEPRFAITIPLEEYTICHAPEQTLKVAYKRKDPANTKQRTAEHPFKTTPD